MPGDKDINTKSNAFRVINAARIFFFYIKLLDCLNLILRSEICFEEAPKDNCLKFVALIQADRREITFFIEGLYNRQRLRQN